MILPRFDLSDDAVPPSVRLALLNPPSELAGGQNGNRLSYPRFHGHSSWGQCAVALFSLPPLADNKDTSAATSPEARKYAMGSMTAVDTYVF